MSGEVDFIAQHAVGAPRNLHSATGDYPRVLIAILAKQKEEMLPLFLRCIEALDYPKSSIALYIRTNNNTDQTAKILRDWSDNFGEIYFKVELDDHDVKEQVERFGVHEWNAERFSVLGRIRQKSLARTYEYECAFYFVVDVDNFIRPETLKELVALNLPIVAPFLRTASSTGFYSNYHAAVDSNGYYKDCEQYQWILNRWIKGVVEVPLVHCTYLVRSDVIPLLSYEDGSFRYEYVIFADSARCAGIPQYLDNRQVYGYIAFGQDSSNFTPDGVKIAQSHLFPDLEINSE